ncbi:uncharacterized protein PV09_09456 [Verruconis gallopava]|uniref:Zn(2)-C6 fungal-type domain-containing protein n=1 Tax=Verruconis gallopava TaxID=253628 RepID=A0A0D1YDI7_9PEZI|nr:uncharacterized protein PV09_09456 [Verruconis gallopava]KIV98806.1 hypothetical protein PV09_09456 [Verruconis gallopava]
MATPANSRKGKRISRAACDMCRERKVQCFFPDTFIRCSRCERADIPCTFISARKPRGPLSRYVGTAKHTRTASPSIFASLAASQRFTLSQFCSAEVFETIFNDFLTLVYPVVPLVHPPSFQAQVAEHEHFMPQPVFRQCLAIAAVTIASLPRKFNEYARSSAYTSTANMVSHAVRLVQISRIIEEPCYTNKPSLEHLTTSLMLSMASHYTGDANQGWAYACEAMLLTRVMHLGERSGYEAVSLVESELRKRAFWCGYIFQIHDRISSIVPHTGLSYLPRSTDWDFIIPRALHDDELTDHDELADEQSRRLRLSALPPIVGFVALIKVFRCCADLFSFGVPGSINQAYSMASGPFDRQLFPSSPDSGQVAHSPSKGLAAIFQVFQRLSEILNSLPDELKLPSHKENVSQTFSDIPDQFEIMRANIHITSLYLQSTILETFASTNSSANQSLQADVSDEASRVRTKIWRFRESIAQELLQVLESCTPWTLEANGASMIIKVREIASTLLDDEDLIENEADSTREYITKFVEILSNLDFGARRGEGTGSVTGR